MTPERTIAKRNLDALTYFMEEGGRFALATGRGPTKRTFDLFAQLPQMNAPCILLNGALLYDSRKREALVFHGLPDAIKETIIAICHQYPQWPISICTATERFQVGPPVEAEVGTAKVEEIADPWGKILFHVTPDQRLQTMDWLQKQPLFGAEVTASDVSLVEVVPQGISKGAAVEEVIARYGFDRSKVAAIGDYFNDYQMLSVPGIRTFCPNNAAPEIKELCGTTVCSVYDGALADVIELLGKDDD
jgi:hypothetical protein